MERDIDPNPKVFSDSLDDVKLYFGCQISKERFSVLWSKADVRVDFGIGMKKWQFSVCHDDKKFKLDLSYENIWKVELHQPHDKTAKYLLIQVVKFNFHMINKIPDIICTLLLLFILKFVFHVMLVCCI
jgi:RNA-dependent RNA polymerase